MEVIATVDNPFRRKQQQPQQEPDPTPINNLSFWIDYGLPRMYVKAYKSRQDGTLQIIINKDPNRGRPAKLTEDYIEILPETTIPTLVETGAKEVIPK